MYKVVYIKIKELNIWAPLTLYEIVPHKKKFRQYQKLLENKNEIESTSEKPTERLPIFTMKINHAKKIKEEITTKRKKEKLRTKKNLPEK